MMMSVGFWLLLLLLAGGFPGLIAARPDPSGGARRTCWPACQSGGPTRPGSQTPAPRRRFLTAAS